MPQEAISADQFRTVLLGRLTRGFADFVAAIEAAVLTLPDYSSVQGTDRLADVRASIEQTATAVLAAVAESRDLTPQQSTLLTATGSSRFEQGLPERAIVTAVRAAMGAGLVYIEDTARRTAADTKAPGVVVAQVLHDLTVRHNTLENEITAALAEGHDRQRVLSRTRGMDGSAVVDRIVTGRWTDEQEIEYAAKECGIDVTGPLGVVAFVASSPEADAVHLDRAVQQLAGHVTGAMVGTPTAGPVAHVMVLVPDGSWEQAVSACEQVADAFHLHVLCYEPLPSYRMLGMQYPRTVHDLALPETAALPPGVLSGNRLAFYRLCTAAPVEERVDFVERVAGPLLTKPALVETVETLYRVGGGAPRVAEALGCHPNTVRGRFETIERRTGLDIEKPEDLHQLVLALRLRRVLDSDA